MSLRLITMPPSHFSEKARWALDRSKLEYVEERHAPLFHRFALKKVGAKATTVPALVTESGAISESQAILKFVDSKVAPELKLYPEEPELRNQIEEFERELDDKFGPAVVRWAYFYLIPRRALYKRLLTDGVSGRERLAFGLMTPIIAMGMKKGMKINQEAERRAYERMDGYFRKVSEMLADGRQYLFGNRFTAADLTFSALANGPAGATGFGGSRATEQEVPQAMLAQVKEWRETAAGKFVQRIYDKHRRES